MSSRRTEYKKGTLEAEDIIRLEAVPTWGWDPRADHFEENFQVLAKFVAREGHARVSQSHLEDGVRLGSWVSSRRVAYRKPKLEPEYIAHYQYLAITIRPRSAAYDGHGRSFGDNPSHFSRGTLYQ